MYYIVLFFFGKQVVVTFKVVFMPFHETELCMVKSLIKVLMSSGYSI